MGLRDSASRLELTAKGRVGSEVALTTTRLCLVGSLRDLARESTRDGTLRSRWLAGVTAGTTSLAHLMLGFLFSSLIYAEGVLDSGVTDPISSWIFPFFGSNVTVDDGDGIAVSMTPGPLPFIVGGLVLLLVAKPWRRISAMKSGTGALA